jgi:hypothetical protein
MMPWTCSRPTVDAALLLSTDATPAPMRADDAGELSSDDEGMAADAIDTNGGAHAGIAGALQACAAAAISALRNSPVTAVMCHDRAALARTVVIGGSILTFIVSGELLYAAATQPGVFGTGQTIGIAICSLLMPVSAATAFSSTRIAQTCCPNAHSRELHPLPV